MNLYFGKSSSFGINRVIDALLKTYPMTFNRVQDDKEAEIVIIHATGRKNHITEYAQNLVKEGKEYIVIQYVLGSSRNPDPKDWMPLWNGAKFVWSYYDLGNYVSNFYHAPLGSNFNIFYPENAEKRYTVGTIGNCYKAECIGENHLAVWLVGGRALHIGEKFTSNPIVNYVSNVKDDELRVLYNQCNYFSSLRRKDGFEIPAIESLLCGVRPVMLDTPNYRQWFDGLSEFIPEKSVGETVGNLKRLYKRPPREVTIEEINETKNRFNWDKIMKGFWERCTI